MIKNFINLTNGIEAIKEYNLTDYSFIRIQSTLFEQKHWEHVLNQLDSNLLMNLAMGNECIIYDYGSRNGDNSRVIWQGIPFITFILYKIWLNKINVTYVKDNDVTDYFHLVYKTLSKGTKRKLKYYIKFINTDTINLKGISKYTSNDGKYIYYRNLLYGETK
jgi:hypothetical protein